MYKKVAENGDWLYSTLPEAYKVYLSGDKESAFIHYLLASERGYEIAQSNVAWLLDKGLFFIISLFYFIIYIYMYLKKNFFNCYEYKRQVNVVSATNRFKNP